MSVEIAVPVFVKVVAAAVVSVGKGLYNKASRSIKWEDALTPIIEDTLRTTEHVKGMLDKKYNKHFETFWVSPVACTVIRKIWASAANVGQLEESQKDEIRQLFVNAFVSYLRPDSQDASKAEEVGHILFGCIQNACEKSMTTNAGHELRKEIMRDTAGALLIIKDELSAINRTLTEFNRLLVDTTKEEIDDFTVEYARQQREKTAHVRHPDFDTSLTINISDIFVAPKYIRMEGTQEKNENPFEHNELVDLIDRTVILGDPGGGKSTAAQKICFDLASAFLRYDKGQSKQRLPILIHIRSFAKDRREKDCSIVDFIEISANRDLQLQPLEGAFEFLLTTGNCLVVFDGLDEVLDVTERQEISEAIRLFCSRYPSIQVLVTSRIVGYKEAALKREVFSAFRLAEFDLMQISEYCNKWFFLSGVRENELVNTVDSFISESAVAPELRSNPLMLALMCNIYRGQSYIPHNRPELYHKCSELLFKRWDRSRGIKVSLPFEEHILPAMRYLAYWIFSNQNLHDGVKASVLIERTTEYLLKERFEKKHQAENAAREFIDFCTGRAWVFTDMGAGIYKFAHNTFLEYFAAEYLVSISNSPADLSKVLLPRIAKQEWDVVSQIAIQLMNESRANAGSEILNLLLKKALKTNDNSRANILNFALRSLTFMVPRPEIVRLIARSSIDFIGEYCDKVSETVNKKKQSSMELSHRIARGIAPVANYIPLPNCESRSIFSDQIKITTLETANNCSPFVLLCICQYIIFLDVASHGALVDYWEESEYWDNISRELIKPLLDLSQSIALTNRVLARIHLLYGTLNLEAFVNAFGWNSLFTTERVLVLEGTSWGHLAAWLASVALYRVTKEEIDTKYFSAIPSICKELGELVLHAPLPLNDKSAELHYTTFDTSTNAPDEEIRHFVEFIADDMGIVFGITVLEMIGIESSISFWSKHSAVKYVNQNVADAIRYRLHTIPDNFIPEEFFKSHGYSDEQTNFLVRWIKKEISMIGKEISEATSE